MGLFDNFPYTNFHELNLDAIIKILREMQDEWEATKTEWSDMKSFINNYFENLDVTQEISDKIDKMARSGALYDIISPDIARTVTAWLAEHISETTPTVDASLTVSGAAADALVTGNDLRALEDCNARDLAWIMDKNTRDTNGISYQWQADGSCRVNGSSVAVALCNMYAKLSGPLPKGMEPGKRIYAKYSATAVNLQVWFYKNGSFLSGFTTTTDRDFTVPADAEGLMIRLQVLNGVTVNNEFVKPRFYTAHTEKMITNAVSKKRDGIEDVEVLTDYEVVTGFITGGNEVLQNGRRTSLIPVYPGKDYYVPFAYETIDTVGAFYDIDGQFISGIIRDTDTELVAGFLRKFTTPAECYNVCLNMPEAYYAVSLCSKPLIFPGRQELNPVYPPRISVPKLGNFRIPYDNNVLQQKQNRKLCCIGDSVTFIDRIVDNNVNLGNRMFGWQEYPGLLYDSVTSYGFSGGAWGPYEGFSAQNIYDGIVTAGVDLSGFDDFILFAGFNGMGTLAYPMGTLGTWNDNPDGVNTMLGAMRGVIDYIMQQNPKAKIYLMTNPHTDGYYQYGAYRTRLETYRNEILRIATVLGLEVIDAERGAGFTKALYDTNTITYDTLHPNDNGMSMIGLCALNAIMSK